MKLRTSSEAFVDAAWNIPSFKIFGWATPEAPRPVAPRVFNFTPEMSPCYRMIRTKFPCVPHLGFLFNLVLLHLQLLISSQVVMAANQSTDMQVQATHQNQRTDSARKRVIKTTELLYRSEKHIFHRPSFYCNLLAREKLTSGTFSSTLPALWKSSQT